MNDEYDWSRHLEDGEEVLWQRTINRRPSTILRLIALRAGALLIAFFAALAGTWMLFNLSCGGMGLWCDIDPQIARSVLVNAAIAFGLLMLFDQNVRTASAYALTTNRVMHLPRVEKPGALIELRLEKGVKIRRTLWGMLYFKRPRGRRAYILFTRKTEVNRVEKLARRALHAISGEYGY